MEAHSLARTHGGLAVPRSRKLLAAFGDERLVEQLRRGNEVAFEVLYDRHHAGVLSYCRHMLGSRDEAEDALQQAFISAHADLTASDKPIRFKAWIYTIARNRCLSMLRARREQPSDELERISTAGLSEEVQQRADLQQLLEDLQELPEEQRGALILSELGDLSHADVAEVIGCEAAKVKSLVFQARSGLIERREARETPCEEIREQLATLRGGSLRRGPLRRHVKACPGCSAFRDEVRRQRQMVAAILPVIPTLGLKESALAAVGVGAASTGGGIVAAGGAGTVVAAKAGAAKIAVIALATGTAVGGGVAIEKVSDTPAKRPAAIQQADPAGAAPAGAAGGLGVTGTESAGADDRAADRAKDTAGLPGHDTAEKRAGENGDGKTRGKEGRRHEGAPGFEPERGTSNGDRARDFARGRGKGRKRGLDKQSARAGSNGKSGQARRGGRKPRSERGAARRGNATPNDQKPPKPAGPLREPPTTVPPTFEGPPPRPLPERLGAGSQKRSDAAAARRERRAAAGQEG